MFHKMLEDIEDILRHNMQEAAPGIIQAVLLAQDNRKVPAIKALRQATGMGLKASKDLIDTIKPLDPPTSPPWHPQ